LSVERDAGIHGWPPETAGASGNVCTASVAVGTGVVVAGPLEANLPRAVIRVQLPGRTSQREQRIAQGHGAEVQVCRRQRQRVQLDHSMRVLAQAVAAALEHMPHPIPDRGAGILGHGHVDGLQEQVALRRHGGQFDQCVAGVAHNRDVLGRFGFGRGRDFLDGVGRDRRSRRRAATGQHRPQ
jgi:hypothetical protein